MTAFTSQAIKEQPNDSSSEKKERVERTAKAHWQGDFKEGKGTISTQSGILKETNFSFKTRFKEGESGTNPEELLGASHAGCYTMSVAAILTKKGLKPTSLDTVATVIMEGLTITTIHLSITGAVTGITADEFSVITKEAEKNCLISRVLNIPITSEAHFIV